MTSATKTLYPFQQQGADWLRSRRYALLADEPGLGKTVQAIAAVEKTAEGCHPKCYVVCPASVVSNWYKEILDLSASMGIWDVFSYERAAAGGVVGKCDYLILDEAHYLKSLESKRSVKILGRGGLVHQAKNVWALTGTPVLNRPLELYPLLRVLSPATIEPYRSLAAYGQRYCGAYFNGREVDMRGASRVDELAGRLKDSGFMLRRLEKDVLGQLPPLDFMPTAIDGADDSALRAFERGLGDREEFISSAASVGDAYSQMGDMATMLRLTGEAKIPAVAAFVETLLEGGDEKVVVFAHHRSVVAGLRLDLLKYNPVVYQGGMSSSEKDAAVAAFRRPDCRVFIGNIKAAGTGINGLQEACSVCVFAEGSWVPGEMTQAAKRLHRMGQTAGRVRAYVTYLAGSLEEAVMGARKKKEKVIGGLGL